MLIGNVVNIIKMFFLLEVVKWRYFFFVLVGLNWSVFDYFMLYGGFCKVLCLFVNMLKFVIVWFSFCLVSELWRFGKNFFDVLRLCDKRDSFFVFLLKESMSFRIEILCLWGFLVFLFLKVLYKWKELFFLVVNYFFLL